MALTVIPETPHPLATGLRTGAEGFFSAFTQKIEQERVRKDLQTISERLSNGTIEEGLGELLTPQGTQMGLQIQLQRILNPVQKAQVENLGARTEATQTQTGISKQLAPEQLKALSARTGLTEAQIQSTLSGTKISEQVTPGQIEGQQARTEATRAGTRHTDALTGQVGKPSPMNQYQTALALESEKRTKLMGQMTPLQRKQFRLAKQDQIIDKKYRKALIKTEKGKAALIQAQADGFSVPDRTEFERLISTLPVEQKKTAILINLGLEPGNASVRQMPMPLLQEMQELRQEFFKERDLPGFSTGRLKNILYSTDPRFENYRTQIEAFFEGLELEEPTTAAKKRKR